SSPTASVEPAAATGAAGALPFVIETVALRKVYGVRAGAADSKAAGSPESDPSVVEAVRGVDLRIAAGAIYALLGPNGAGKTTLHSMLTTLLEPTSGTARVAGFDVATQPAEVRRRIGVTFQEVVLDQELSGRQVLDFHGRLYGMAKADRLARLDEVAALVELTDVLDRRASRYSGGMKRRLELARGLMTQPQVLFLDEPTQGLDPQNRAGVWRYVRQLRDEVGMTILLTTHYMDEAEALADQVGIIDHGKLVVEGKPAELVRALGSDVVQMSGSGPIGALLERLTLMSFVQKITQLPGETEAATSTAPGGAPPPFRLQVGVDNGDRRLAQLVTTAADAGVHIHEISVARPSLGDVFLAHTGHALRDE
ncbi:MAG: ATP-binding cassette domain-containing protein, partial [Caldilineaceae bacterium]